MRGRIIVDTEAIRRKDHEVIQLKPGTIVEVVKVCYNGTVDIVCYINDDKVDAFLHETATLNFVFERVYIETPYDKQYKLVNHHNGLGYMSNDVKYILPYLNRICAITEKLGDGELYVTDIITDFSGDIGDYIKDGYLVVSMDLLEELHNE